MNIYLLIIGLGIGKIYVDIAKKYNWQYITVDKNPDKQPDFLSVSELPPSLKVHAAIIATPNYLHCELAEAIKNFTDIIIIEKPGCATEQDWIKLRTSLSKINKRLFLIRNYAYRGILQVINNYNRLISPVPIKGMDFLFILQNRVPGPGSWFTTKQKARGGASQDLMPHFISMMQVLLDTPQIKLTDNDKASYFQKYTMQDIDPSMCTWGEYVEGGIYNVDDHAYLETTYNGIKIRCAATWKTDYAEKDIIGIRLHHTKQNPILYNLGFCPEIAYEKMLFDYLTVSNYRYNTWHKLCDQNIHKVLERFIEKDCQKEIITCIS